MMETSFDFSWLYSFSGWSLASASAREKELSMAAAVAAESFELSWRPSALCCAARVSSLRLSISILAFVRLSSAWSEAVLQSRVHIKKSSRSFISFFCWLYRLTNRVRRWPGRAIMQAMPAARSVKGYAGIDRVCWRVFQEVADRGRPKQMPDYKI